MTSLWTPTTVGNMHLPHRLALAPMTRSRANADGTPSDLVPTYYAQRASLGLLITGWRLRLKAFAPDDDLPSLPSVNEVWNSANWFEREAFDLYGIIFEGHLDLRRILTDYGFIGHPFRKDFPLSGHVEMRYDAELRRVVYEPVSIEPREITPRIIREDKYGGLH